MVVPVAFALAAGAGMLYLGSVRRNYRLQILSNSWKEVKRVAALDGIIFPAAAIKAKCAFMMSSKDVAKVMQKVTLT